MDKIFIKTDCKFNGLTYQEVKPVKQDPDNHENVICEISTFGTVRSIKKTSLVQIMSEKEWHGNL
jgi:hypothetical protein